MVEKLGNVIFALLDYLFVYSTLTILHYFFCDDALRVYENRKTGLAGGGRCFERTALM